MRTSHQRCTLTGRADAAEPVVDESLAIAVADFPAAPILIGSAPRMRSKVRLEQGRHAEVRADLAQAAEHFGSAGKAGEAYLHRLEPLQRELDG